jgi:hypothetical protein
LDLIFQHLEEELVVVEMVVSRQVLLEHQELMLLAVVEEVDMKVLE